MAVAGLVLGIIGLLLCWFPFVSWLLALLAIIFGGLGMGKAKKIGGRGNGMAIAGLVLGVVSLLISILIFVLALRAAKEMERYRIDTYGEVTVPYTAPVIELAPAPENA